MIALHDHRTVLIHFDITRVRDALSGDGSAVRTRWGGSANPFEWYCDWASQRVASLFVLIPEDLKNRSERIALHLRKASPLWYAEHAPLRIPDIGRKEEVWIFNGDHFPLVDWPEAACVARRHDADIIVFGPPDSADPAHYPDTVAVDETDEVLRFTRHYSDSSTFVDTWTGSASFLVTTGEHAAAVLRHILSSGWGLDSIGALTRRFNVRWSTDSCLASRHDPTPSQVTPSLESEPGAQATDCESFERAGDEALIEADEGLRADRPVLAGVDITNLPQAGRVYLIVKRIMDLLLAGIALIVLSPLFVLAALVVKLSSHGPILFGDRRQGLGGREFLCWKFRTMVHGAQRMQDELRKSNEVDGPQFKIASDPRLTRIGAFYRRYNIDEFPQILNVLWGQMSFVGPRPSPDHENQMCPGWRRTRLSMRPGITGLWQVMRLRGESDSDFQEWIYYDVEYARHRSLWLDVQILLHTPLTMFAPRLLGRFARALRRRGICAHARRLVLEDVAESTEQGGEGSKVNQV